MKDKKKNSSLIILLILMFAVSYINCENPQRSTGEIYQQLMQQEHLDIGIGLSSYSLRIDDYFPGMSAYTCYSFFNPAREEIWNEQNYDYIYSSVMRRLSAYNLDFESVGISLHELNTPHYFYRGLEDYDIVIYKGYPNLGLGPSFSNLCDIFYMRDWDIFTYQWIYSNLLNIANDVTHFGNEYLETCNVNAKLVIFISDYSNSYFDMYFKKYAPDSIFIGFDEKINKYVDHVSQVVTQIALRQNLDQIVSEMISAED